MAIAFSYVPHYKISSKKKKILFPHNINICYRCCGFPLNKYAATWVQGQVLTYHLLGDHGQPWTSGSQPVLAHLAPSASCSRASIAWIFRILPPWRALCRYVRSVGLLDDSKVSFGFWNFRQTWQTDMNAQRTGRLDPSPIEVPYVTNSTTPSLAHYSSSFVESSTLQKFIASWGSHPDLACMSWVGYIQIYDHVMMMTSWPSLYAYTRATRARDAAQVAKYLRMYYWPWRGRKSNHTLWKMTLLLKNTVFHNVPLIIWSAVPSGELLQSLVRACTSAECGTSGLPCAR